jgi:hypothetical protein
MRITLAMIILLGAMVGGWGQIAQDSCGVAVELREKYGPVINDTGTVIIIWNNYFVITKKDAPSAFYPVANYTVSNVKKLIKEEVQ